ncbi:DNA ligase 1-like [Zophobas morio]|uniref:DNA ligase 1-like n=1 Tax=Zophobas morio TaxID=2755281 RepID=UPI0030834A82
MNEPVPYSILAETFEIIEQEPKRLKITEIVSDLLRSIIYLTPEDLLPCVYLCLNKLGPAYEGAELGVGESLLVKAMRDATGRSIKTIQEDIEALGDIGLVAASSRGRQKTLLRPKPMTVRGVYETLKKIAAVTGNTSTQKKVDLIKNGLVACRSSCEAKFWIRSLSGKLRIGLAEQTVLTSLGHAIALTPPAHLDAEDGARAKQETLDRSVSLVKTAFCEMPSLDKLVPALLEHPLEDIPLYCTVTPGIPVKPMLAHPTKCIRQILSRFEGHAFTCEYKYDGERAQLHLCEDGTAKVYSRNQEDTTQKFPDIIARVNKIKKDETIRSFILDCEAVAWDASKRELLPFQVLSTRKRKEVEAQAISIHVCVFAFDLLYLNGTPCHRLPFCDRRMLLKENFIPLEGQFQFAKGMDSQDTEDIQDFLDQSIKDKCEGLMIKTLSSHATYEISKRSRNWLKLKADYLEGIGDTLDLVVIGATKGQGKRTGVYGNFLLACYNPTSEQYETICKLGTGLSEENLDAFTSTLQGLVIKAPKGYYKCDRADATVWFSPSVVWEIKASDLSISPKYQAAKGLVHPNKGISLRFPRFLRIREDKTPEEATTSQSVAHFYNLQQNKQELVEHDEY